MSSSLAYRLVFPQLPTRPLYRPRLVIEGCFSTLVIDPLMPSRVYLEKKLGEL